MGKSIEIVIDGKKILADSNKTIFEIAKENGIFIPTLCYNDRISKNTSCFVCIVKNIKNGKFIPSCSAIPMDGDIIETSSEEVLEMRRTALNLLLSEHIGDCEAPCTIACPAHARVEEYVREGKKGNFLESLKIIKERIPLPMSIGRVCPRFCEKDCRRNVIDRAVSINDFKRLAADLYYEDYIEDFPEPSDKKVAIIGAGPAGLATAYFLRKEGILSTIFEEREKAGGMLRYGIPEFRLPKKILDKELEHFNKIGIEIHCNVALGRDITIEELSKKFDAIVLTIGCWESSSMRIDGEELAVEGIKWLELVAKNNYRYKNPGKTIVIGGGNTAIDCSRTAIRLGSQDVSIFYRRTEKEMPAERIEIEEAKEEGVKFKFLVAPQKLYLKNNKLILRCQKMRLGEPDASGRRRPIPIPKSEFDVEADTVIAAIGQKSEKIDMIESDRWGNVIVDEFNRVKGMIFAAGDCVIGASTVVEAVASGRKSALSISSLFNNKVPKLPKTINVSRGHWSYLKRDDLVYLKEPKNISRVRPKCISIDRRKNSFDEIFPTFTEKEIMREGERCLECSCSRKHDCKLKGYSETYGADPEAIRGEKIISGFDNRHPAIIHDKMKCIKCGICIKVCKEIINKNLLSYKNRGYNTQVGTVFDKTLPESCAECGECIKECPVGALTWKDKERYEN